MGLIRFFRYCKRVKQLKDKGWYLNMAGGMTDSHCMRIIDKKDLEHMSEQEFAKIVGGRIKMKLFVKTSTINHKLGEAQLNIIERVGRLPIDLSIIDEIVDIVSDELEPIKER